MSSSKILLVTGASRGIGAATAVLAASQGWAVAVNYVANAQARCGLHAEAFRSMETLVANNPDVRFAVRQAAFNIAICPDAVQAGRPDDKLTPTEKALRDKYADRALTLLEDLVNRLAYKDVVQLKTDPDLDAVRADPRFKAILDKLEKGAIKP